MLDLLIKISWSLLFAYIIASPYGQGTGIYSTLWVGIAYVHRYSLLVLCLSFFFIYFLLRDVPVIPRFIATLNITVLQIYIGGLIWNSVSRVARGHGMTWYPLLAAIACLYLDNKINHRYQYRLVTPVRLTATILLYILTMLAYYQLSKEGFWANLTLWDAGLGSVDPNQSINWLYIRTLSFLYYFPLVIGRVIRETLPSLEVGLW